MNLFSTNTKIKLRKLWQFISNPRLIFCFFIGWIITNGWSYVMFGIGVALDIQWMTAAGAAYLAFLWLPISPEKLVTFAIAIALLKLLFPNDQKTLAVLQDLHTKAKNLVKKKKAKRSEKKKQKRLSERESEEDRAESSETYDITDK